MRKLGCFLILFQILCCSTEQVVVIPPQSQETFVPYVNPTGTYTLFHNGYNRTYHYYQPLNLPKNAPLVFVLHGHNAIAAQFMGWFDMYDLADEYGFAVVFPQGLDDNTGRTHWNAGLTISTIDDVDFLSRLALFLQDTYQLNPEKTFSSGYSNGGFMSYELVVKRPDIFKAAASISGTMSLETWNNRDLAVPVPILQLSGKLDRIVPVLGMNSFYGGWGGAPEIAEIMAFWGTLNQSNPPEVSRQNQTIITKYTNVASGNEVWYYLIENLDHGVPFGINYDVHAPSLIWEFFNNY